MTPPNSIDSPSLKGPTVVLSVMKVTVVATEPVEVQVRVEDEDPGVNTRGLMMLGIAARRETVFYSRESIFLSQEYAITINLHDGLILNEREGSLLLSTSLMPRPHPPNNMWSGIQLIVHECNLIKSFSKAGKELVVVTLQIAIHFTFSVAMHGLHSNKPLYMHAHTQ